MRGLVQLGIRPSTSCFGHMDHQRFFALSCIGEGLVCCGVIGHREVVQDKEWPLIEVLSQGRRLLRLQLLVDDDDWLSVLEVLQCCFEKLGVPRTFLRGVVSNHVHQLVISFVVEDWDRVGAWSLGHVFCLVELNMGLSGHGAREANVSGNFLRNAGL